MTASGGGFQLTGVSQPSTIQLTANGAADDLTVALLGAQDASLILSSAGTNTDALQVTASAGGLVMTASG
eukprot:5662622-Prorocentrum_lima.AAC.1